jgi:hypothetical protein
MNWLNIPIAVIRAPEYAGSDPVPRATWLNLMAYCAEQENGGRIVDARRWKDRQWQQTCGVTLAEVDEECELWRWNGDDILVWGYPEDKEAEVRQRRDAAKVNGGRGGRVKKPEQTEAAAGDAVHAMPDVRETADERQEVTHEVSKPNQRWLAEEKEKGREENGKEGEREGVRGAQGGEDPASLDFSAPVLEAGAAPPVAMSRDGGLSVPANAGRRQAYGLQSQRPGSQGKGELLPVKEVQKRLGELWPAAPRAMTGMELHDLQGSLSVLCELGEEDWTACGAWNAAPLRELGREKRWPRDRAEFGRNASQAVELVRTWWKAGGKRWHAGKVRASQPGRVATGYSVGGGIPAQAPAERQGQGDVAALAEFLKGTLGVG